MHKSFILIGMVTVLLACGQDMGNLYVDGNGPGLRNPTTGLAAIGLMQDAAITAYQIPEKNSSCSPDALPPIGEGRTNGDGRFNLDLNLKSGYVLYTLRGGNYTEGATQQQVNLSADQELYTIHYYDPTAPKDVMITPWSHMQAGLFCWLIENRQWNVSDAIEAASNFTFDFFGFDPRYAAYKDPTDTQHDRTNVSFDDGMKLGFLNAGLSEFIRNRSVRAEQGEHTTLHSIHAAQMFFQDIYYDGVLNGRGADGNLSMAINGTPYHYDADTYRYDFPLRLLRFYDHNNRNGIKNGQRWPLYELAAKMNNSTHNIAFKGADPAPPLDAGPPTVEWLSSTSLTGIANVSLRITDLAGVNKKRLRFYSPRARGQIRAMALAHDYYTVLIDTRAEQTGVVEYSIQVADVLGQQHTYTYRVTILSDRPYVRRTSAARTNATSYVLEALVGYPHQYKGGYTSTCTFNGETRPARRTARGFDCLLDIARVNDGMQEVVVNLTSSYGRSYTPVLTFTKDTTAPNITTTALRPEYHGRTNVIVPITVLDAHSAIRKVTHAYDGETLRPLRRNQNNWLITLPFGRLATGRHTLTLVAEDALGNQNKVRHSFVLLKDEPGIWRTSAARTQAEHYVLAGNVNAKSYRGDYRIACTFNGAMITASITGNQFNCLLDLSQMNDGAQEVMVNVTANYGRSYARPLSFVKDQTAPNINASMLRTEYSTGENLVIPLRISDAHSPIRRATYVLNGEPGRSMRRVSTNWEFTLPLARLANGQHTLILAAEDALGNRKELRHSFVLLKDAPVVRRLSAASTNSDHYILTGLVNARSYRGDYAIACAFNGTTRAASLAGNRFNCAFDLTPVNDGRQEVTINLTSNYGRSYLRTLTFVKDTTAPNIIAPKLRAIHRAAEDITISLRIVDAHSSIRNASYAFNAEPLQPMRRHTNNWNITLPFARLATGQHLLRLVADDALGNQHSMRHSFLLLKDGPVVRRTSPAGTRNDRYTLVASVDARSYAGAYQITCTFDGTTRTARVAGAQFDCGLDLTHISDGRQEVMVNLTASYGRSYARIIRFVKDTTAPSITTTGLRTEYTNAENIVVPIGITDAHSAIRRATYKLNYERARPIQRNGSNWKLTLPFGRLGTNRHTLLLRAEDALGNTNNVTHTFVLIIDEPALFQTSPARTKENAHTFTAFINANTYLGRYNATCQVGTDQVNALIIANHLGCRLNLAPLPDGNITINIALTPVNYMKIYTYNRTIIKDTQPPQIAALNVRPVYGADVFTIDYRIEDAVSTVARVRALHAATNRAFGVRRLQPNGLVWRATIDPRHLANGRHTIRIIAADTLEQEREVRTQVLIVQEPPQLNFTHRLVVAEPQANITGTFTPVVPEARIQNITCLTTHGPINAIRAEIQGLHFACRDYPIAGFVNQTIDVEVCDAFANCAIQTTSISHDSSPPSVINEVVPRHSRTYQWHHSACLVNGRRIRGEALNQIPLDCPQMRSETIRQNHYRLLDPSSPTYSTERLNNPDLILLDQAAIMVRPNRQRQVLEQKGVAFVGLDVVDNASIGYASPAPKLNITYSYTQYDCDPLSSNHQICPLTNQSLRFADRPVPPIGLDASGERVNITLAFTNAFLNHPGTQPWYMAQPQVIHALVLKVCDEAGHCIRRATHFRARVVASAPIIDERPLPDATRHALANRTTYLMNSRAPIVTKKIVVSNPRAYPVWYAFYEEEPTSVIIQYSTAQRLYGFTRWGWTYSGRVTACRRLSQPGIYTVAHIYGPPRWTTEIPHSLITQLAMAPPDPAGLPQRTNIVGDPSDCIQATIQQIDYTETGSAYRTSAAYPQSVLATSNVSQQRVSMSFHDIRSDDGRRYRMNLFRKLEPGATHHVVYRERVPTTQDYIHSAIIPMPSSHAARPLYDTSADARLNNVIKIKYTQGINDQPDFSSIQIHQHTSQTNTTFTAQFR